MRVYVAGRISGVPGYFGIFAAASDRLRQRGYEVFNPAAANLEGLSLPRIMAHALVQLCDSDAIAMLPGWWRSGGARVEWLLAKYLKLKVMYL